MWKLILALSLIGGLALAGLTLLADDPQADVAAQPIVPTPSQADLTGFARAIGPYEWEFPADHGPHPAFQTEWWYYTGNLATESGRRFGFQFTIFRRALTPDEVLSSSEWRTNQIYLAHFTVTDVAANHFHQAQRLSRGAAGLAGAAADPVYHVWLEDWEIRALNDDATRTMISAEADQFAVSLTLEQVKPPALQGDRGLSAKSAEPGNASYYYSLSRLLTEGTVTIGGDSYSVSGTTWMDHEFSTSALTADAQGWDWFGLHLDDGRDLMLGQIRLVGGGKDPVFGGLLILPDGDTRKLNADDFTITAIDHWTSPHTDTTYPAGWEIRINTGDDEPLNLTLTPLIADQELTEGIVYWEGAVRISGDTTGYGYAELTGYQEAMRGRF